MKKVCLMIAAAWSIVAAAHEYRKVDCSEAPFEMAVSEWVVPQKSFCITDFGAVPGDVEANKAAIAGAVKAAGSSAGGARVVIPPGEWRTGAIRLESNVALELQEGAKVVFTDNPRDYLPPAKVSWEGVEMLGYTPLVYAYGCTNVAIVGKGTLAPEMTLWRKWFQRPPAHMAFTAKLYEWCSTVAPIESRNAIELRGSNPRPHLIHFNRCANIVLDGFKIRSSPFWTIHLYHSENAVLRNLDVYAHGHNNDGVDVEMTRNVVIEDCCFDQGDDAIVLKAGRNQDAWALNRPTENVLARRLKVRDGHVLLGIGSEMSGGVRNAYMHDCDMTGNVFNVFYCKTNERRGGFIENIYMKDCTAGRATTSVVGVMTDVLYQWRGFPTHEVRVTKIRNLVLENVHCAEADHLLMLYGDERDVVDGVTLKNVTLDKARKEKIVCVNARNVTIDGKAVESKTGKAPSK